MEQEDLEKLKAGLYRLGTVETINNKKLIYLWHEFSSDEYYATEIVVNEEYIVKFNNWLNRKHKLRK